MLNRQSLAGALATGTHGTGVAYPIMSQAITAAEVLTSDGQLVFVSQGDEDEEARGVLDALRVHLGALGIVTVLRLQVVDAFSMVRVSILGDAVALYPLANVPLSSERIYSGVCPSLSCLCTLARKPSVSSYSCSCVLCVRALAAE